MRRAWIRVALAAALAAVSAGAGAWAASSSRQQIEVEYRQIQIKVDGEPVAVDTEPFLYLEKGRVFVPARPLAEALGAKVEWEDATSTVQVFTRAYVTSRVENNSRLWSLPGVGLTVRTPLGWIRQPGDGSTLLHLASPLESGLNGLVGISRLPEDPAPLAGQFDRVLESMRAIYTGLEVTGRLEAEGRLSATATAGLAGHPVGLSLRLIHAPGGNWLLFGLYPEASRSTVAPIVEGILDSFATE